MLEPRAEDRIDPRISQIFINQYIIKYKLFFPKGNEFKLLFLK